MTRKCIRCPNKVEDNTSRYCESCKSQLESKELEKQGAVTVYDCTCGEKLHMGGDVMNPALVCLKCGAESSYNIKLLEEIRDSLKAGA
jgi:hypothetical protein